MRRVRLGRGTGSGSSRSSWAVGSRLFRGHHLGVQPALRASEHGRSSAGTMNFTYEPVSSEGTRITQRNEGEPGGFFELVEPMLQRAVKRQIQTNLENLKDLLEARGQLQR
jgi:hypothetical protein